MVTQVDSWANLLIYCRACVAIVSECGGGGGGRRLEGVNTGQTGSGLYRGKFGYIRNSDYTYKACPW